MNRVLRAVVACLLLIALPLQGYAAGTMLVCGGGAASSAAGEHRHDSAASADGHAAHDHGAAASVAASGYEPDAPTLHDAMHGKCSACSSCCSAAALPTMPLPATAETPRAAPLPLLEHARPGHGPARLERPPRLNFA